MPEYLSPGVYVEETTFRARSIEGVATSTAGFVGQCRYGPSSGEPVLITSFDEFQRMFGSLRELNLSAVMTTNYLAHAVNHFFENGGKRVYIARIFGGDKEGATAQGSDLVPAPNLTQFRARFPGLSGNLKVTVTGIRSGNLFIGNTVKGLRTGDVVEIFSEDSARSRTVATSDDDEVNDALGDSDIHFASIDAEGNLALTKEGETEPFDLTSDPALRVQKISLSVQVSSTNGSRTDNYTDLSAHPDSSLFIGNVLRTENYDEGIDPPADRTARIYLSMENQPANSEVYAKQLLNAVLGENSTQFLEGGLDGKLISATDIKGGGIDHSATGLAALAEIEDIAIIAAPGASALSSRNDRQAARNHLITHCENLKYRFAIMSADVNLDTAGIRNIRGEHDTKYGALYYPWLVVNNPYNNFGQAKNTLLLPPEGALAGIYARSDIERGVHKAPANEVVRGALRFSRNVSKGQQDTMNPEGINCLRFFEGRGYRVWGARTMSSDPEWTYINVRRLFIFLEHSIDRGTQWAVFEPNNEKLWLKVRMTIESFLYDVWRTGALLGKTPEEAYFVRCDRTTMSQGDLDNGRLICLIGVAPTKPAEFAIFRIGQWTAEASII